MSEAVCYRDGTRGHNDKSLDDQGEQQSDTHKGLHRSLLPLLSPSHGPIQVPARRAPKCRSSGCLLSH